MKFREKRERKVKAEVDLTPLIDVVFQLIIFFMVALSISMVYGISIRFPSGSARYRRAPEPPRGSEPMIV